MGKGDLLDRKAINCVKESLVERDGLKSSHYYSCILAKMVYITWLPSCYKLL